MSNNPSKKSNTGFTAQELMDLAFKHKKVRQYPYAVKTRYGKQLGEQFVPNQSYNPSGNLGR